MAHRLPHRYWTLAHMAPSARRLMDSSTALANSTYPKALGKTSFLQKRKTTFKALLCTFPLPHCFSSAVLIPLTFSCRRQWWPAKLHYIKNILSWSTLNYHCNWEFRNVTYILLRTWILRIQELTTLTDAILSSKGMFSCCHKKGDNREMYRLNVCK
jgi:hypothetical protein